MKKTTKKISYIKSLFQCRLRGIGVLNYQATALSGEEFFHDVVEILSNYNLYRLLPDGMVPVKKPNKPYRLSLEHNIFGFQNIVALRI
ncbi:hypothetical protein CSB45_00545 [candidate division KSB3 bacterium]|uniref:Uncharacterized protein n=1 Tax=candidate division KSB3 bacterium TaxID=2044937 RepID=A0A2G6EF25_9BACT|nr:MAG: hypothetical protein CSB45_00545 [candidate division KSB3 bacterium]